MKLFTVLLIFVSLYLAFALIEARTELFKIEHTAELEGLR